MGGIVDHPVRRFRKFISNHHFWAITFIMAALIVLYNANHIVNEVRFFELIGLEAIFTTEFIHDLHRSLFIIPLLYAGAVFRLKGAVACWLVFLAAVIPRALYFSPHPGSLLRTITFALIALLAAVLLAIERNHSQREKEVYTKLEATHHTYATQVLQAQEDERHRLSQELHDGVLQDLVVIANNSEALITHEHEDVSLEAKVHAEKIRDMALHAADDVRRISHDLRPSILDIMGLTASLRWLTEHLAKESGITIDVIVNGEERRLNPKAELIIFRIGQEALNNVVRHSKASQATITLNFAPERIRITIWDNGKGFLPPRRIDDLAIQGKLGLKGMQERANLLDAILNIQSEPAKGTTITLEAKS